MPGETTPFLLVRDAENCIVYYYLTHDKLNSPPGKPPLFELSRFLQDYSPAKKAAKTLANSIENLRFSGVSPNCVPVNFTVAKENSRFQCITQASVMNLGD